MRRLNVVTLISALALIEGCASTPHGSISYYLPKATTQWVITQTLSCNASGDHLHEVVTITPTTSYSSDLSAPLQTITPRDLDGTIADADIGFTFTDDGRLSGVNTSTTGQGGEIVKGIVSVLTAAAVAHSTGAGVTYDEKKACSIISDYGAKTDAAKGSADPASPPVVTVTYADSIGYGVIESYQTGVSLGMSDSTRCLGRSVDIPPDASSADVFKQLRKEIPGLGFTVSIDNRSTKSAAPIWGGALASDGLMIKLNRVALANLTVKGAVGNLKAVATVWTGQVPVPLTDSSDLYDLPIPQAALFGSQKFTLGLSDYGSIEKIEYATTGAADAADAASAAEGAIAGVLKKPTEAQQASDVQAKADLIYEQQRLAACQADPKSCAGK